MALLVATNIKPGGDVLATVNTLGASDTYTFDFNKSPILMLRNATGGPLTVNLDGADSALVSVDGYGSVDPTSGLDITVADGTTKAIKLKSRNAYLQGEVTITGGDLAEAIILES